MRRSSVKHNTFDVLNFILQGKGNDKDEEQIKEAISNIRRRMSELGDGTASDFISKGKDSKNTKPMFSQSKQMAYLLRTKRNEVLWFTTQFLLKNVYLNRHLSSEEMIRQILQKDKDLRNLFDIRYLQSKISGNNFFTKMTKEGSFELTYQCLKEFQYEFAQAGTRIIKYGEVGDKFYIICKGLVDVYIPAEK